MQGVSQVSLPMRIALLATLAFSSLWFVALRPKPATDEAAPPPPAKTAKPASAPGKAAAAAHGAVDKANAAAARKEAATGGKPAAAKPATRPAQAAEAPKATGSKAAAGSAAAAGSKAAAPNVSAATPVDVPAKPPKGATTARSRAIKAVLGDLADRKVVLLLFWDRSASDDQEVRRAVARVDRHGGKVAVHVVPIAHLSDYEPLMRGVPVVTSPTILVIDRARRARAITGLTVTGEIDETVTKALRVKP